MRVQGCAGLTNAVLPAGVTEIGYSAFAGCSALRGIGLPASLTAIGDGAFQRSAIESLTLPAHFSEVGAYAFSDCEALLDVTLPASLGSVGYGAFAGCDRLASVKAAGDFSAQIEDNAFPNMETISFFAAPGTRFAAYLEGMGLSYQPYAEGGTCARITLDEKADLAEFAGFTLRLSGLSNGLRADMRVEAAKREYVYYGLMPGDSYRAELIDAFGQTISVLPQFLLSPGENALAFPLDTRLATVSVQVFDGDGLEAIRHCSIAWYGASGQRIAQGFNAIDAAVGSSLSLEIALDEYLLARCVAPERIEYQVLPKENVITVSLSAIESRTVSGVVSDAVTGKPLSGVSVRALQTYSPSRFGSVCALTNAEGRYAFEADRVPTVVSFALDGYQTADLDIEECEAAAGAVALRETSGWEIPFAARLLLRAETGGEATALEGAPLMEHVDIEVYNETDACDLRDFALRGGTLVIVSGADEGDALRVTMRSAEGWFAPCGRAVTVGADPEPLLFEATQYGAVRLTRLRSANAADVAMLFSGDRFVAQKDFQADGTASFANLPAGEYSLVAIGMSDRFAGLSSPRDLDAMGLAAEEDYRLFTVSVADGAVAERLAEDIPLLRAGEGGLLDAENTSFTAGRPEVTLGSFASVRLRGAVARADSLEGLAWEIVLPEGCHYYDGSLTVDSRRADCAVANGVLTIPVERAEQAMRLCIYLAGHVNRGTGMRDCLSGSEVWLRKAEELLQSEGLLRIRQDCGQPDPNQVDGESQPVQPIMVNMDPSGCIYEAVLSNRVSGAVVTVYQNAPKEDIYGDISYEEEAWNASSFDQVNPQTTLADGEYAWDVPEGQWRVKAVKEGYETGVSPWLTVPPIQTDVNIALVSRYQPEVKEAVFHSEYIDILFSKYMRADTLTAENIHVTDGGVPVAGRLVLLDGEASPTDESAIYASRVRFCPDEPIQADRLTLSVSTGVKSYASVALGEAYEATMALTPVPMALSATANLRLLENSEGTVTVEVDPPAAGANRTVEMTGGASLIEMESATIALDENGRGEARVKALLPGVCQISLRLSGSDLTASCTVTAYGSQTARPSADIPDGATVPLGALATLTADSPDDTIYYTLDGTCPKISETRMVYGGPIPLTRSGRILACAQRADCLESEVLSVGYAVAEGCSARLSAPEIYMRAGDGMRLSVWLEGADGYPARWTWTSDDESVASVDPNGVVTKTGSGSALITASVAGLPALSAQCRVSDDTLPRVRVPASVRSVLEEAMRGDIGVECVDLSACASVSVGKGAFSGCSALKKVLLPTSFAFAPDAFEGCGQAVLYCRDAEQAERAAAAGLPFVLMAAPSGG